LTLQGIPFERQKPTPVIYKNVKPEGGYRMDLVVDGRVVVELNAVESFAPIHEAVVLAHLRLSGCDVGLD
jgi:GxxExxY protein